MRRTQSRLADASQTSRRVLDRLKVKLLRDARIAHKAGEVVETTPAEGAFLISVGSAEELKEKVVQKATAPVVETAEKAVKAPKAVTTAKKPTRAKKG